jgi:hypothetical protein
MSFVQEDQLLVAQSVISAYCGHANHSQQILEYFLELGRTPVPLFCNVQFQR